MTYQLPESYLELTGLDEVDFVGRVSLFVNLVVEPVLVKVDAVEQGLYAKKLPILEQTEFRELFKIQLSLLVFLVILMGILRMFCKSPCSPPHPALPDVLL